MFCETRRDAETVEYSGRGASSTAFRKKTVKGMIANHAVNMALHHGLLLARADFVLLHGAEERAADAEGTFHTGAAATSTARTVSAAPSAPISTPSASGGVIVTSAGASFAQREGASGEKQDNFDGMVDGPRDRVLLGLLLEQHQNHEVCRTST